MFLERKPDVRGTNALNRLTVRGDKSGSQRLVPRDQAVERAAQGVLVQFALQPQVQRDVVGLADAVDLRQEPQPLLRE